MKLKTGNKFMKAKHVFVPLCFSALLFISGCSGVGGDVAAGRNALQTGRPNDAIGYLAQAAAADPNYKLPYRIRVSVLAYLGGPTSKLAKIHKPGKLWKKRSVSIRTIR